MKKLVLITLAGVMAGSALFAQNTNIPAKVIRNCGTEILSEDYEKWIQPLIEKQQKEAALSKAAEREYCFYHSRCFPCHS